MHGLCSVLFFADALMPSDAWQLVASVKARSDERVATLEAIRPEGDAAALEGNIHPLLTLELGIAVHRAMVDVCERFERAGTSTFRYGKRTSNGK